MSELEIRARALAREVNIHFGVERDQLDAVVDTVWQLWADVLWQIENPEISHVRH